MIKLVNIKNRKHVFVDQIKSLLNGNMSSVFTYKVEYFTGYDKNTEDKLLCFDLSSSQLGVMYIKRTLINNKSVTEELENLFMGQVIADFISIAVTLISKEIVSKGKKFNFTTSDLNKDGFIDLNMNMN